MKYGIVGYGVVGKATHKGFYLIDPVIYDLLLQPNIDVLSDCNVIFFCIPTNTSQCIDDLMNLVVRVHKLNSNAELIIRSTVTIGTCDNINKLIDKKVFYIPEFLRDRFWETDCLKRPIVVGSVNSYLPDFLKNQDIIQVSYSEAEILKMFSNNIASCKVVLANHFYDISQKTSADYDKIIDAYFRVEHDQTYLEVNESLRGFGGKCLPKDLNFIIDTMSKLEISQKLFNAIKEDNSKWPITIRKS